MKKEGKDKERGEVRGEDGERKYRNDEGRSVEKKICMKKILCVCVRVCVCVC